MTTKKENKIKQAQKIINEISDRRHWLLWHNQKFRTELQSLIKKTNIQLKDKHPVWMEKFAASARW